MECGCDAQWTGSSGGAVMDRRQALTLLAALVAAGCAPVTAAHRDAALRLAEESPSVDLHSHPGMFPSSPIPLEGQLKAGHVQGFSVRCDESERIGGSDSAPSPLGYFTVAVGF